MLYIDAVYKPSARASEVKSGRFSVTFYFRELFSHGVVPISFSIGHIDKFAEMD